MASRLTPQQVEQFKIDGYLIFDQPVLRQAEFDALKQHFEDKLAAWQKSSDRTPEHMDVPHQRDPKLFRWLFADEVLDLIEPLIGRNIALWSSHFICKPAGSGKRVPWHEDSFYWGKVLDPMEVVTIWLAIDAATPDNGCMRLIPRTHHHGYSQYAPVADQASNVFEREITAGEFDEATAVDVVLEPNKCSLHHAKLIHGSKQNVSRLRRCGYTMRYMPTTTKFCPKHHFAPDFPIYLARGRDCAGNRYGDPNVPVK